MISQHLKTRAAPDYCGTLRAHRECNLSSVNCRTSAAGTHVLGWCDQVWGTHPIFCICALPAGLQVVALGSGGLSGSSQTGFGGGGGGSGGGGGGGRRLLIKARPKPTKQSTQQPTNLQDGPRKRRRKN